jgi:hypothetical protein
MTLRVTAAVVVAGVLVSNCALRKPQALDYGIPGCPPGADRHLLTPDALQCWFTATHDRWRTLGHQSHLEALVVAVEARDLRDAEAIARRVIGDPMAAEFSEILVYAQAPPEGDEVRIRRVRWTRGGVFETLDFRSAAADMPLTVRSQPMTRP